MAKRYARLNWQNRPNVATPINAANLNKMDKGIDDCDNAIEEIYAKRVNNVVTTNTDTFLAGPVGKLLHDQITEINNNLANIKTHINRQNLNAGDSIEFMSASSYGVYMVITHQTGIQVAFRSAYIVYCALDGFNGTVAPILTSSNVTITSVGRLITISNIATAGGFAVSIVQLV